MWAADEHTHQSAEQAIHQGAALLARLCMACCFAHVSSVNAPAVQLDEEMLDPSKQRAPDSKEGVYIGLFPTPQLCLCLTEACLTSRSHMQERGAAQ